MARQSAKVAKSIPQGQVAESGRASAIKMAMEQIEKQYGKGSIMKFGDKNENLTIDVIPTGAFPLDIALGVGGLPRGRVVEIFGPEASGKTTVCLSLIAEAQKRGGVVAFIDAEHALDPLWAQTIGVKLDDLLISQPDTGEQALEITEQLIRSGGVDVVVVAPRSYNKTLSNSNQALLVAPPRIVINNIPPWLLGENSKYESTQVSSSSEVTTSP